MDDYIGSFGNDYWKDFKRSQERAAELAHERELALIRTVSRALVWTGTADELTATVTEWFETGKIQAADLQEALHKANLHFSKPDGMPVIKLLSPAVPTAEDFSASPTYQKLTFRGKDYDLTRFGHAPRILKVLHESHKNGELGMTTNQIRKKAKLTNNGKMYDWFRSTDLWKHLVVRVGKDLYRLDLPSKSDKT